MNWTKNIIGENSTLDMMFKNYCLPALMSRTVQLLVMKKSVIVIIVRVMTVVVNNQLERGIKWVTGQMKGKI
jgi:hypothetical protein